jgi:hypothetical protein
MSNVQVGIRKWGTKPATNNYSRDREDLPRLPYLRLMPGLNKLRIVTDPATYYQARYKAPDSKKPYGDRVRSAWPTYEDCPVKNDLGLEPKPRSMAIVIDRADGCLKLFDMSVLVDEQIEGILEVKNSGRSEDRKVSPRDFDIVVKFNPKAKKATGFYAVVADDSIPMNEEDLALVRDVGGSEVLDKILAVKTACWKPETVRKQLEKLGWKPGQKAAETAEGSSTPTHQEPVDDDYTFDHTA